MPWLSARPEAMPARRRAEDVDRHVAGRVRQRRIMLGLTQRQLADLVDATHQQIHDYETGADRISAGRLHRLARALAVEVGHFYEGLGPGEPPASSPPRRAMIELARSFAGLRDRRHQEAIRELARALAGPKAGGPS